MNALLLFFALIVITDGVDSPPGALNIVVVIADAWRYSAFSGADEPDSLAHTPQ
jgi:hypothetical protein